MDAERFDGWTRLFAAASRRGVLWGLTGGALAMAFGDHLARGAAARCVRRGEACGPASCCAFLNLRCRDGVCRCRKGFADCDKNGSCETNRLTDPDNCGKCGNRCASGSCVNGACTCDRVDDCPEVCVCADRVGLGDGGVCARSTRCVNFSTCATDDDCPPRELCAFCNGKKQCRGECLG